MLITHSPSKSENPNKRRFVDSSGESLNMDTVDDEPQTQKPELTGDPMIKLNLILFNQDNNERKLKNRIDEMEENMTERFNENDITLDDIKKR